MAEILKAAPVVAAMAEELALRAQACRAAGAAPTLVILRVGNKPDDLSYERGARKRCESVGVDLRVEVLPEDCSQDELLAAIHAINDDESIHGCIMMRPLPGGFDEHAACQALDPAKDVDCMTDGSLMGVFVNNGQGYPPCTAQAVLEMLDHYGYDLTGAKVTVIGRSLVIGKPVSVMLQARNATVTMCHTRTKDLASECRNADIVVVAAGRIGTLRSEHVRAGQTIIDVGINWDEDAGKLAGDVDFASVEPIVAAISPVPGGVGSVTTAVLAKHVIDAAERTLC
ncbi:bifunctional 5,10-methylenetetrahydrofolate dehydrogenase/5,10-methenyltetrahydrofolate cyclohydrolase [Slackia heliotrinireducens]|uniref:bifunctional 5,10-methylenetetrahydrofolate dehydrogenase/5,10-methenyltetrahydrofolate cyclohydrolase n=1 Tax=Slackia heliotrinireducens TaxID=84110 RepID=UPI00331562BE